MKRTEPKSVARIIEEALDSAGLGSAVNEHRALYVWPEVVGQGVNRYTTRRFVANGVMHVFISSAPLKNELSFHRSRLAELINKAVGADVIKSIQFH